MILGAGLMGAQIGCEYALADHDVTLVARNAAGVAHRVDTGLSLIEAERLAAPSICGAARRRLHVAAAVDDAGTGFDLVVESLPEDLSLKTDLLRKAAAASPQAVLASNTSSISITSLGAAVGQGERMIGTHYLNPPLLMPTVEVIAGDETAAPLVDRMVDLLGTLGKVPVVVRRDVPGFIWNRLQFALLRECAWLVDNGVASVDDVDLVVREGLARRWRRVGPFAAISLGGLETWLRAAANLVPLLSTASELGELGRFGADQRELARLEAFRDEMLAADMRLEREQAVWLARPAPARCRAVRHHRPLDG